MKLLKRMIVVLLVLLAFAVPAFSYPAFNVQEDGQYSRDHSKQVVTYVIRPNYDWEEQP